MNVEWSKQKYQSLKECWQSVEGISDFSDEENKLISRYEDIEVIVQGDRIWPPVPQNRKEKFVMALRDVLSRLPQEEFDQVKSELGFVLEDPALDPFALNVPAPSGPDPFSPGTEIKLGNDTIVFFRKYLELSSNALIGLIAHEIAHSFVKGENNKEDETLTDAKARSWRFEREIDCLEHEKKGFLNSPPPKA